MVGPATMIPHAAPAPASAQINVRISPDLKARGDSVLLEAGFSPTQAVRALWDFAAQHAEDPEAIARALLPECVKHKEDEALEERKRRAVAIARGPALVRDACLNAGISWHPGAPELDYDELKELAYAERYGEELGWS